MNDITGFGKGVEKLIDAISKAIGVLYEPKRIRKQADALAYKEKVVANAKSEAKSNEIALVTKAKIEVFEMVAESKSTIQERLEAKQQYLEYRKQINLEKVIEHGLNNVENNVSEEPIDEDWLAKLINYAENATTEKMQLLWGKVLAGEVTTPGSFSVKSLDILQKMTPKEADAFQRACNISSILTTNQKILIHGYTNNSMLMVLPTFRNEFEIYEFLTLPEQFALSDIGLIHKEGLINGSVSYKEEITINNNGIEINLRCKRTGIGLLTYKLTEAGNELSRLIPDAPNETYLKKLKSSLSKAFKVLA